MYSIEEILKITGYSKNTVYNLCPNLDIRPVKGLVKGLPGKGMYSREDVTKLLEYKSLIDQKYSQEDAYAEILSRRS